MVQKYIFKGTKEELEELNEEIKKIANKIRARLKGKLWGQVKLLAFRNNLENDNAN